MLYENSKLNYDEKDDLIMNELPKTAITYGPRI